METVSEKKRLASVSFWCGLLALPCFVAVVVFSNLARDSRLFQIQILFGAIGIFVLPVIAIMLGLLAHWQNYRGPRSAAGKAAANRGFQVGIVGLILIPIMTLLIPIRERTHPGANEASAVGSLRTIHLAADVYARTHPEHGYPASLADLSVNHNQGNGAYPIDDNLSRGEKSGYRFTYTPRSSHHNGKVDAYDVLAEPAVPHETGNRYFFTDQTGTISSSPSRDPSGKKPL